MKVIKRDGKMVEYDKEKIIIAIGKANNEIPEEYRASDAEIKEIIKYIESLNKKRILVEDIQDIIELKLMEAKKYELAKHYIVYRYNRALVRKSNTTDDSLLSIIRNGRLGNVNQKSSSKASYQREYIAREVSKDLTKRLLLPEKIVKAHEEGMIFFHDMESFMQPVIDASILDIKRMLSEGFKINNKIIKAPVNFIEACIILTESISNVLYNQSGGVSIDLSSLGRFIKMSNDNIKRKYKAIATDVSKELLNEMVETDLATEIKAGVKLINYQINSILETKLVSRDISFLINIDKNDKYLKENILFYNELVNYKLSDDENDDLRIFYVINDLTKKDNSKYYYLTEKILKCAKRNDKITFISSDVMINRYGTIYAPLGRFKLINLIKEKNAFLDFNGRFTQGSVSINLAQIGIIADGDEEVMKKQLEERLLVCKEALMCRYHSLSGCTADVSPIHWQSGAIARIDQGEKIDDFLKNGYSSLLLGYVGLKELVESMTSYEFNSADGINYGKKILNLINSYLKDWYKESNISINLFNPIDHEVIKYFYDCDIEKYGKVKNITDQNGYSNALVIDSYNLDLVDYYKNLQVLNHGGCMIKIKKSLLNDEMFNKLIENVLYFEIEKDDENNG